MTDIYELMRMNILSPMILAFALGVIVTLVKSDLRIPDQIYTIISIYLLFSIGLEGGFSLSEASIADFIGPALVAAGIGAFIPLWSFTALRRFTRLDTANIIAIAIHFGGVSSVTLSAAITFLVDMNQPFEGFMPTLYVIVELPAFFVALVLVAKYLGEQTQSLGEVVRVTLTGKTFLLLGGGVIIGLLSGETGQARVEPFFFDLFPGVLTLFMLQMGTMVGERLQEIRTMPPIVFVFALTAPLIHATLGIVLGSLVGLSAGGAFIMATLVSSASYISAPALVQSNIPQANPGVYMTTALVIAFPFNLIVGLPLYFELARLLAG